MSTEWYDGSRRDYIMGILIMLAKSSNGLCSYKRGCVLDKYSQSINDIKSKSSTYIYLFILKPIWNMWMLRWRNKIEMKNSDFFFLLFITALFHIFINFASGTSGVYTQVPASGWNYARTGVWGLPPPVKLKCRHITLTVFLRRKTQPKAFIFWIIFIKWFILLTLFVVRQN